MSDNIRWVPNPLTHPNWPWSLETRRLFHDD
jgi:hypothetical protein